MAARPGPASLEIATRVAVWDATLGAIREYFRGQGLAEVATAVRRPEVALEPYIEPVEASGQWLQPSPELAMKELLAAGSGPIFQIAPVFRAGERGDRHREGFHLVEWYRRGPSDATVRGDVEALVESVHQAIAARVPGVVPAAVAWETESFRALVQRTCGIPLRGDESADELQRRVETLRPDLWVPSYPRADGMSDDARTLSAWTTWFSQWSDRCLDPWLATRPERGLHVVEFPAALAALAELAADRGSSTGAVAHRFESHVGTLELANGYRELRDPARQRDRFAAVAELRRALGRPPISPPAHFLATLHAPGLPSCSGAALGVERLIMSAGGWTSLDDICLEP